MDRRRRIWFASLLLAIVATAYLGFSLLSTPRWNTGPFGVFYVRPYLQLGDHPQLPPVGAFDTHSLIWQTAENEAESDWELEVRVEDVWKTASKPVAKPLVVEGLPPYRLFRGTLEGLRPGLPFTYRVKRKGKVEFEATATARKPEGVPQKFAVFGDSGAGTADQFSVAHRVFLEKPDYVVITGDVVYARGRVSEYLANHFPVYNSDKASPADGAPLLRSTLFFAAPGNHDLVDRSLDRFPDGLAYFYYWDAPRNGPFDTPGAAQSATLQGSQKRRTAFLEAARPNYPATSNYSFDYGDAHWTVLDANPHADWNDPKLRSWLETDLASASKKAWRFVAFHHPGFSSSRAHFEDQHMRTLAPIFEQNKVDIVFNGHVHNYQRSFPMKFVPQLVKNSVLIEGKFTLDKTFDGTAHTKPDGVIYVVTGGGGASLYDSDQTQAPKTWQEFTAKFISDAHSFTIVDLDTQRLIVRQISDQGRELDRFSVTH